MITLAELATNSDDKLVQGFVNEVITDSFLLSRMTFDDCLTSSGTSDLAYAYKRVKTPMTAAFRALNSEPALTAPEIERVTTSVGILSDSWKLDRVSKDAAEDLYEVYIKGSKDAIIRKFNKTVISGDTEVEENGFDGLDKAVTGSSTEFVSAVDLSSVDKASALAFATEMDELFGSLSRTPDALMMAPKSLVRVNAVCRVLGLNNITRDDAGKIVRSWNGVPIEEMKDGAMTSGDIYAVCFGMEEFHGITLKGGNAISVNLPDWTTPGAVKTGDAEFVCGCALKKTKAAGVLREKPAKTLDDMTLDELKAYAAAHSIDITGKTTKAEILAVIKAA